MLLNGSKKVMNLQFDYEYIADTGEHRVLGKYNNIGIFNISLKGTYNKDDIYSIDNIKKEFPLDVFKTIKGIDNNDYLILMAKIKDYWNTEYRVYIFNDDFQLISKNMIDNDYYTMSNFGNITYDFFNVINSRVNIVIKAEGLNWYKNDYCLNNNYEQPCHTVFKIENNKIYYLALKLKDNYSVGDYGTLEERVYTINNNELDYEVINNYKVTEIGNMF